MTSEIKESNSLSSVERSSDLVVSESLSVQNEQVYIEREVVTSSNTVVVNSSSLMVNTKQTAQKENPGQGTPARFPQHGKPGGKAAKHLMATSEDDNENGSNNQVQGMIRAGRKCRVWGGKARIYKCPAGVVRKYRPSVGALKEIRHYQREYSVICSKAAVARLICELCEKKDLCWQAKAVMALHEAF